MPGFAVLSVHTNDTEDCRCVSYHLNFEIRIVASIRNNYTRYSCCKQELRRECDFRSSSLGSPSPFGWLLFFQFFFLAWFRSVLAQLKSSLVFSVCLFRFVVFLFLFCSFGLLLPMLPIMLCVMAFFYFTFFFRWPYAMTYKNAS